MNPSDPIEMVGFDRLQSGRCPTCDVKMTVGPRTILGGSGRRGLNPGPRTRKAYENYDCPKCNSKFAWLVEEPEPVGTA